MKKRILSIILALIMIVTVLPTGSIAFEGGGLSLLAEDTAPPEDDSGAAPPENGDEAPLRYSTDR